ncbi:hypothetical protein JCM16303_004670 [Sporobolomyces ruberrimus]
MSTEELALPRRVTSSQPQQAEQRQGRDARHSPRRDTTEKTSNGPSPRRSSLSTPSSTSSPPRLDESHPFLEPTYPVLSTCSLLIFATIWGVLARLGLEWLGTFAESKVFAIVWAQIVGCLVMGFVTERKKEIDSIFPPFFTMLGTGFCGSLTTWSTMAEDTFVAFANLDQPTGTSRFTGFLSGVSVTLITLFASMCALEFGVHLDSFLPSLSPSRRLPRRISHHHTKTLLNHSTILLGPLFWLGSLFLLIFGPPSYRSRATFAIVFGPFGTVLRYTLSTHLNSLSPSFPLGTFLSNTLATLLISLISLFSRHPNSPLSCSALKGLNDGLCGSLSTISTFVVELRKLKRGESYRYFGVTWVTSQGFLVVVLGSWVWSGNRMGVCWS